MGVTIHVAIHVASRALLWGAILVPFVYAHTWGVTCGLTIAILTILQRSACLVASIGWDSIALVQPVCCVSVLLLGVSLVILVCFASGAEPMCSLRFIAFLASLCLLFYSGTARADIIA